MQFTCVVGVGGDLIADDPDRACGECRRATNLFEYESHSFLTGTRRLCADIYKYKPFESVPTGHCNRLFIPRFFHCVGNKNSVRTSRSLVIIVTYFTFVGCRR